MSPATKEPFRSENADGLSSLSDYGTGSELLSLCSVAKSFGATKIVDGATLSLRGGRALFLAGPSGVGKSTLLEIAAGLIKPDAGSVRLRGKVSLLFQDDALIPWLTASANVAYVLPPAVPAPEAEKLAEEQLRLFDLDPQIFPSAMSGGMRRRLSLARTLAVKRPILLLDEPFAFLDARWRSVIASLIVARVDDGDGVIVTGHETPSLLAEALGERLDTIAVTRQPISFVFPAD